MSSITEYESDPYLTIELTINMDYEQMRAAILDYFKPDCKSDDEITSWYVGFAFDKNDISIFYYNHYDAGDDRHCFEIKEEHTNKREYYKNVIKSFAQYLCCAN